MTKLADGDPPLTEYTVNEATDFLEWLMQVPFTDGQRAAVREHLVSAWKANDREEIDGAAEVLKVRTQLLAFTTEQREVTRQALLPEAVKQWRTEDDAVAKLMVQIYDGAHKPIGAGDPPLTRQAADAAVELLYFMASHVAGRGHVEPDESVRQRWAQTLAQNYGDLDEQGRRTLAEMPMTWAALRYAWPSLPAAAREELREQWGRHPEVQQVAAAIRASGVDNRTAGEIMRSIDQSRMYRKLGDIQFRSHMNTTYGYRW